MISSFNSFLDHGQEAAFRDSIYAKHSQLTGRATLSQLRREIPDLAKTCFDTNLAHQAENTPPIDPLVTKVGKAFLEDYELGALSRRSLSLAATHFHVIQPLYQLNTDYNQEAERDESLTETTVPNLAPDIKKYIVVLSVYDRLNCLGLSCILLSMVTVNVARICFTILGNLFCTITNTLFRTHYSLRDQLIVEISQFGAMGVLIAANLIGIFWLSGRDKLVLQLADTFSSGESLKRAIKATHL